MSLNFNLSFAMRHGIVILSRIKAIKHARGSQLWPSRSSLVPLPFFSVFLSAFLLQIKTSNTNCFGLWLLNRLFKSPNEKKILQEPWPLKKWVGPVALYRMTLG